MATVRRLTAILAADVAGYSRLMGADEEGTHERLKGHLGELVNPKIAEHRGRIVKNTGDGRGSITPGGTDARDAARNRNAAARHPLPFCPRRQWPRHPYSRGGLCPGGPAVGA